MTLDEFKSSIPYLIIHPSHGEGEREILINTKDKKGVCYRHRDKTASFGTYGETWEDVCNSLKPYLIKEGYIK